MKFILKFIPFFLVIIFLVVGYILSNPVDFGICERKYEWGGYIGCLDKSQESLGFPMYRFTVFALPIVIALIFINRTAFISWFKFALWFIPLTILLVWMDPLNTSGQTFAFFNVSAGGVAHGLGFFFLITSLALIIRSYINTVFLGEVQRAVRTVWWRQLIHPVLFISSLIWFVVSSFSEGSISLILSLFSLGVTFFMLFLRSIDFKFFLPATLVFWGISILSIYLIPFTTTLAYTLGIFYSLATLGIIVYHIYTSRIEKAKI